MTERVDVSPVAGLNVQIGLLMAMLEDVTSEWLAELGEVSRETIVWQPFPGAHSIGGLMLHIADVEAYWIQEVAAGESRSEEELRALLSRETQQYQVQWPVPPVQPLSWYHAKHDGVRARTRELVTLLNDPDYIGTRQKEQHRTEFTLRWLLHHVLTHEAYHGGQAVLLSILHERR